FGLRTFFATTHPQRGHFPIQIRTFYWRKVMTSHRTRTIRLAGYFCLTLIGALLASLSLSQTSQVIRLPSFAAPPLFSVAGNKVGVTGLFSMAKGDFNGDGKPDFATVGFACSNGGGTDQVAIYFGNGDGTFQTPVNYG